MKKADLMSILITFLVGAFAGLYLYVTYFAQVLTNIYIPDIGKVSELSIVGEVYGGCRNTCPSFQVTNDGSYRYLYTPEVGQSQLFHQGVLPSKLYRQLLSELVKQTLVEQSKVKNPTNCNSYVDGNDVKYEIIIDREVYILDSCETEADLDSQLWITLHEVWEYYFSLGNK
ncbi:MAG: hypothetical protein ACI9BF_000429 [Candidatus Paceibacteria bacterium]|jgi:hypothetical protein